jgi:hypothetical protein
MLNAKQKKELAAKQKEIDDLQFFRNACYNLYQQGKMTSQCELVINSSGKLGAGELETIKISAHASPEKRLLAIEKVVDSIDAMHDYNNSDISMKVINQ